MLQEVCGAIGPVRFSPTSGVNPNTYSRRLSPRRMLCSNLEDTCKPIGPSNGAIEYTVNPFDSVVLSVFTPLLFVTGVAKPLFTAPRAARLRRPCVRLRANRREAMAVVLGRLRSEMKMEKLL